MSTSLDFYAMPALMTSAGDHSGLLAGLPADLGALCQVVQGLLIHPLETQLYEVELTSTQRKELQLRTVAEMLRKIQSLDDRPLDEARPPKDRLVGNCRDHAVLLCALLRSQGTPARVRVGFAAYFKRRIHPDHWIVEVWQAEQQQWIMVDPQLDEAQRQAHSLVIDPLDIPADQFFTGGRAWSLCRAGKRKSSAFGHNNKVRGFPYMRLVLLQDFAALNKVEVLPWDNWWELGSKSEDALTGEDRDLLDQLAALTLDPDGCFDELRLAYEDAQFSERSETKLKLLGLSTGSVAAAHPELRQAASARLSDLTVQETNPGPPPAAPTWAAPYIDPVPLSTSHDPAVIIVKGAQQHNLKHLDITIPRYKLVVLTGVSGSGKSSLAFDTLYAEGQRRYVESLSAYVRRYLDQMDKPKVDFIGGLSPAIAIEQKSISKNPRSTVGTVTEVLDYLRVLYSRAGVQHCPQCGQAIDPLSAQQIAERLGRLPPGLRFQLLAPVVRGRKGDHQAVLESARQAGYVRARIDSALHDLSGQLPRLKKSDRHQIDLLIDRLVVPAPGEAEAVREFRIRLIDSVETTLKASGGLVLVQLNEGNEVEEILLTERNACPACEITLPKLTPNLFSFNAPAGMCPECNGLGARLEVDPNLIIDHPELSLLDGASRWYGNIRKKKGSKYWLGNLNAMAEHYGVDLNTPWQDLPQKFRDVVLFGSGDEKVTFTWESSSADSQWRGESIQTIKGIIHHVNRLFRQTQSEYTRRYYASFMSQQPCPACRGTRLCAEARYVTVGGRTFSEVTALTIEQALTWVRALSDPLNAPPNTPHLSAEQMEIVGEVLKELYSRLRFMLNVGLHYLTLDRPAPTLSGGEGQRIRLASQLGCGLVGVLYILDEPSIGLHARDQRNLLATLTQLRDMGNTVLVVEHDAETMRTADWLIDLGPGAGVLGGEVVSAGTPDQVAADPRSLTGRYLSGALQVIAPNGGARRIPKGWLTLQGARLFNLKNVTARFPLGVLTCVTGVSGSGKSSLVAETLYPALERQLHGAQTTPGPHDRIEGLDQVDKVINITQDPIGRTPRSNPATYVGIFDEIRRVFAHTPEARARGYQPDRFSFNVKGGRCEACLGHGLKKIEMNFLPDVWVTCQECKGARYNRHTLEITYKGKTISEVLELDVQEALDFFAPFPVIARTLKTLHDVGLDYIKLGQSATTLSGGEAQRVKLAKELSRVSTGKTVYILDEPTTGLHFADIQRLVDVLHRLITAGNTVIVVEHNLDVIQTADWLIDLGPEGGQAGGYIIAEGTPEQVARAEASHTGRFLCCSAGATQTRLPS